VQVAGVVEAATLFVPEDLSERINQYTSEGRISTAPPWRAAGTRARFQEPALGYRYPISWALANASVRFRAPSLTIADDR
jgi:hypothetical protein